MKKASDKTLTIFASFIAFLSLAFTIWEGYEVRHHNRLSVKPMLIIGSSVDRSTKNITRPNEPPVVKTDVTFGLNLANRGLGPAVIERYDILLIKPDGQKAKHKNWHTVFAAAGFEGEVNSSVTYSEFDVVTANERLDILKLTIKGENKLVLKPGYNITLDIAYQSIYDEKFSRSFTLL